MTEIGNRSSRSKAGAKGVKIERIYTTPGVHPYDEVTWEKRDVVQQNWKTGETIFEQRGVEFPDFWSVNASTIVTTKYFRGAVGTAAREVSLKQLIDRVVLTYVAAGKSNGYFASAEDAEIFRLELQMRRNLPVEPVVLTSPFEPPHHRRDSTLNAMRLKSSPRIIMGSWNIIRPRK